jgi:hypothetical protein
MANELTASGAVPEQLRAVPSPAETAAPLGRPPVLEPSPKPRLTDAVRGLGVIYGGPLLAGAWWLASVAQTLRGSGSLLTKAGVVAPALYYGLLRRRMLTWGATTEELTRPLPGDDLIANPTKSQTRAITINATPEQVWPWLVQLGYQRGGWYSYDALEAAAGAGDFIEGRSADRIHLELQTLKPDDLIRMSPWTAYRVDTIDPPRALVLAADAYPGAMMSASSWAFILEPVPQGTRLLVRGRSQPDPRNDLAWAFEHLLEAPHFIMERRMLLGIKQRAERAAR